MQSPTRVVFVQHPREARVPISTCRMAHLSLPNSELHVALNGEALELPPDAAVLFPSDDAVDVAKVDKIPSTLVVVDGTWSNAKKVVSRSPKLLALPRISLNPDRPGNYRIRKEPKAHCLSTIEAVALVLGHFEGAPLKFQPILSAFDSMVETQLGHVGKGPARHARFRMRNKKKGDRLAPLREAWPNLVLAYAEGNGLPNANAGRVRPELIQLVAHRPSTGESLELLLRPRRQLALQLLPVLNVSEDEVMRGLSVEDALKQWTKFCGPEAVVATWGRFTLDLLEIEGARPPIALNLKQLASQSLYRPTGGIEALAESLGCAKIENEGRARIRIAAIRAVAEVMYRGEFPPKLARGSVQPSEVLAQPS